MSDQIYLEGKYGRFSNQDWNPSPAFPKKADDRILRVRKIRNSKTEAIQVKSSAALVKKEPAGALLYNQYCASCHKENGRGVQGTFPPLQGAAQVAGNKTKTGYTLMVNSSFFIDH